MLKSETDTVEIVEKFSYSDSSPSIRNYLQGIDLALGGPLLNNSDLADSLDEVSGLCETNPSVRRP